MKAVVSSVFFAALAGLVNAKASFTNSDFSGIVGGATFDITWTGATGSVTLILKDGDSTDLKTVQVITSGAEGNSFEWTVDPTLPTGEYALEIDDDSNEPNFSAQFHISGVDVVSSATASATSSSAQSSSTDSSSSVSTSSATHSAKTTSTESATKSSSTESSSTDSSSTDSSSTEASSTDSSSTDSASAKPTSAKPTSTFAFSSASVIGTLPVPTTTLTAVSTPTSTGASQTKVPNANDARGLAAPLVPGLLAVLGAALL